MTVAQVITQSYRGGIVKSFEIDTKTLLFGVIGKPVSHSMSPAMHNAAFSASGINGVYLAFDVSDVEGTLRAVRALGIKGLSVTIPHKLSVMDYLDFIDPDAKAIGAVNTVVNNDGRLEGYNTDCSGAVMAILEKTGLKGKRVVLCGAGGAARAIAFGVKKEGAELVILNQIREEGEKLASDTGSVYRPLEDFPEDGCDIIINSTPLGMSPNIDASPVNPDVFRSSMTVMDIVYNPLQTKFLKDAAKAGCTVIDGTKMFIYQGAIQFELWTGEKAPFEIMSSVVLNKLCPDGRSSS